MPRTRKEAANETNETSQPHTHASSTLSLNDENQMANRADGNPVTNNETNAQVISSFLQLLKSGDIKIPGIMITDAGKVETDLDKHYKTPSFSVPTFEEKEKLKGYKNFKEWRQRFELSLQTNMLLPFIRSEDGKEEVDITPTYCSLLNARTLQTLHASVSRSIYLQIQSIKSPFVAFQQLEKMYSKTRMRDYVELHSKFVALKFRVGYDATRFVADFENLIENFISRGTTFTDEYLVATFLQKIPNINDPGTLYASFYNTITSQAEIKKFEEVKNTFLQLDHESQVKSTEK